MGASVRLERCAHRRRDRLLPFEPTAPINSPPSHRGEPSGKHLDRDATNARRHVRQCSHHRGRLTVLELGRVIELLPIETHRNVHHAASRPRRDTRESVARVDTRRSEVDGPVAQREAAGWVSPTGSTRTRKPNPCVSANRAHRRQCDECGQLVRIIAEGERRILPCELLAVGAHEDRHGDRRLTCTHRRYLVRRRALARRVERGRLAPDRAVVRVTRRRDDSVAESALELRPASEPVGTNRQLRATVRGATRHVKCTYREGQERPPHDRLGEWPQPPCDE